MRYSKVKIILKPCISLNNAMPKRPTNKKTPELLIDGSRITTTTDNPVKYRDNNKIFLKKFITHLILF